MGQNDTRLYWIKQTERHREANIMILLHKRKVLIRGSTNIRHRSLAGLSNTQSH